MEQTKQYRTQVDDVQQFINECLVKDETGKVAWSDILDAYNHYKNTDIRMKSKESMILRKQLVSKCFGCDYFVVKIDGAPYKGWSGYGVNRL
jgi:phage/plasmid-associated DNA primase